MPATVNGVGTHYYGRKDLSTRVAACRWCGRVSALESYNTRLWFVVVFIPIIPLGRKRIIDHCRSCTKHMVADADKFEQSRQLEISGSMERYRREPSPQMAPVAHAQLLGFHEHDQAGRFRSTVLEQFPDNAELRASLASQLRQASAYDVAAKLFEEALDLQPDLPEARAGVAMNRMAEGKLDEAHELLDFLEVPGAGQHYSIDPLDRLSSAYQRQGRHEETIEIAKHVLREIPEAGHQSKFRAFVRKSETVLRRDESILPPLEHSLRGIFRAEGSPYPTWLRRLILGTTGAVLLGSGLLINNEYIRRHRTIHVINACGPNVQVQVDDEPPQTISGKGEITVSEGPHRFRLSGPVKETHQVDVGAGTGFFERWSHRPVWVLNPGGEAVFDVMDVHYAEHPMPTQHRMIVGQPFLTFAHIDHLFEAPPSEMRVQSKSGEVTKTALQWVQGQDLNAYLSTLQTDRETARTFAEHRLRRRPILNDLLRYYVMQTLPEEAARAEAFLRSGLDERPLQVQWHRTYQYLAENAGRTAALIERYDRYLKAEPTNAALLYLRGRIEPDWDRQDQLYHKAIEADPRLAWPWMALGRRALCLARWDEGLRDLLKARELQVDPDEIRESLHVARLAKGEAKDLVNEYRARLGADPTDFEAIISLGDALAASGQPDLIEPAVTGVINRLPAPLQSQFSDTLRAFALYQAGKCKECEELTRRNPTIQTRPIRVQSLLALGRAKDVTVDNSLEKVWENPWTTLALSLGLSREGQVREAANWRERACKRLDAQTAETRNAASVLRSEKPVPLEEVERLLVDVDEKALILCVLAERFASERSAYNAAALKYDVLRKPPYALLRRVLEPPSSAIP